MSLCASEITLGTISKQRSKKTINMFTPYVCSRAICWSAVYFLHWFDLSVLKAAQNLFLNMTLPDNLTDTSNWRTFHLNKRDTIICGGKNLVNIIKARHHSVWHLIIKRYAQTNRDVGRNSGFKLRSCLFTLWGLLLFTFETISKYIRFFSIFTALIFHYPSKLCIWSMLGNLNVFSKSGK